MEYQKITNLLDNTPNPSTKFRTKIWVEINDDARGTYNSNSQIKLKNSMLKSSLHDFSDAYILTCKWNYDNRSISIRLREQWYRSSI